MRKTWWAGWMAVLIVSLMLLAGCGSSSSRPADEGLEISGGVAVDPYIVGAVFAEMTTEGEVLQYSTPSDALGRFTFEQPLSPEAVVVLASGGLHVGAPYALPLKAPVGTVGEAGLVLTPFSTLMAEGFDPSAVINLLEEAGLEASTFDESLFYEDYMRRIFQSAASDLSDIDLALLKANLIISGTAQIADQRLSADLDSEHFPALLPIMSELASVLNQLLKPETIDALGLEGNLYIRDFLENPMPTSFSADFQEETGDILAQTHVPSSLHALIAAYDYLVRSVAENRMFVDMALQELNQAEIEALAQEIRDFSMPINETLIMLYAGNFVSFFNENLLFADMDFDIPANAIPSLDRRGDPTFRFGVFSSDRVFEKTFIQTMGKGAEAIKVWTFNKDLTFQVVAGQVTDPEVLPTIELPVDVDLQDGERQGSWRVDERGYLILTYEDGSGREINFVHEDTRPSEVFYLEAHDFDKNYLGPFLFWSPDTSITVETFAGKTFMDYREGNFALVSFDEGDSGVFYDADGSAHPFTWSVNDTGVLTLIDEMTGEMDTLWMLPTQVETKRIAPTALHLAGYSRTAGGELLSVFYAELREPRSFVFEEMAEQAFLVLEDEVLSVIQLYAEGSLRLSETDGQGAREYTGTWTLRPDGLIRVVIEGVELLLISLESDEASLRVLLLDAVNGVNEMTLIRSVPFEVAAFVDQTYRLREGEILEFSADGTGLLDPEGASVPFAWAIQQPYGFMTISIGDEQLFLYRQSLDDLSFIGLTYVDGVLSDVFADRFFFRSDVLWDFEFDDGGFTHGGNNDVWQWGTPTTWPSACADGTEKCWGTDLSGSYLNNANFWLQSPVVDLSGHAPGAPLHLYWKQALEIESSTWDNAFLDMIVDGNVVYRLWTFSGSTTQYGWMAFEADISAAAGSSNVVFRWTMTTDSSVVYSGLYIDEIHIGLAEN